MKESVITCPICGQQARETMPTDCCLVVYDCKSCGARLTDSAPANRNPAWPVSHEERDAAKYTPTMQQKVTGGSNFLARLRRPIESPRFKASYGLPQCKITCPHASPAGSSR